MVKQKNVILATLAAAVLMVLSGCGAPAQADEPGLGTAPERLEDDRARIAVRAARVQTQDFVEYGEYVGEARGVSEVRLTAGAAGRVAEIRAEHGDAIRAGQSLAAIAPERAEVMYETAVLNERLARETWEREQRFLEQGNSFQLKVDQAHLAWLQSRTALLDAETMREGQYAISPIAGIVVRRHIDPNDDVESGDPTFDVADLSRMVVTVGVPESDIAGVRELDSAEVVFTAFPGEVFAGRPTSFARMRSERTLTYDVDVEIDNPDGTLLSGQTARVRLALRRLPEVVVVPSNAVYIRDNQSYVMVVENGVARQQSIVTGPSSERETVVLSGLSVGAQLITEGFNRLADGSPVEIVD